MHVTRAKDPEFTALIDEAIQMELNIGELYLLFYSQYKEDSQFWWTLAIEEENHAALLKTVKQMEHMKVDIPLDFLPEKLEELEKSNQEVLSGYNEFKIHPDRIRAFQFAFRIENSAGELHYNSFMVNAPDSSVAGVFKKLNGMDVDHAARIREYMLNNRIPREDKNSERS